MPDSGLISPTRTGLAERAFANPHVMLTVTMLCWSGNFIAGRLSAGEVPPISLAGLRWLVAVMIMLAIAGPRLRSDWPIVRAHWPILLLLGITGAGLFNSLQYVALNHTSALNALLINSSGPIFVALACLVLFGDRLRGLQWLGIVLSLTGVLTVGTKGRLDALGDVSFNSGDGFMLAAMLTWGVYTAFLRKRPPIHFLSLALVQMIIAAVFNFPLMLWELASGAVLKASLGTVAAVAYVAIFPSIVAYICYQRGVQLLGGARAGIYLHMVTVFGTILSVTVLGESLRSYHLAGFALIILGISLTARKGKVA